MITKLGLHEKFHGKDPLFFNDTYNHKQSQSPQALETLTTSKPKQHLKPIVCKRVKMRPLNITIFMKVMSKEK
jgi:hypothetical protein